MVASKLNLRVSHRENERVGTILWPDVLEASGIPDSFKEELWSEDGMGFWACTTWVGDRVEVVAGWEDNMALNAIT